MRGDGYTLRHRSFSGDPILWNPLTNKMEEETLKVLKKMDDLGGYRKCWEWDG